MVSAQTRPARPRQTPLGDLAAWLRGAAYDVTASGDLETVVSGLTLSSQRSFAGDLYAALPGSHAHGMTFAADALAAGAVACSPTRPGPPTPARRTAAGRGRAAQAASGRLAASVRRPGRRDADDRRDGDPGQDHDHTAGGGRLRARRSGPARIGTVGTRIAGEDVKTSLTTRGARPACAVRGDARA